MSLFAFVLWFCAAAPAVAAVPVVPAVTAVTAVTVVAAAPAVAAVPAPIPAGLARVHGRVLRLGSPDPVAEALVALSPGAQAVLSGADGSYQLDVAPGWALLSAQADGYDSRQRGVTLTAGRDLNLNWSLDSVAFEGAAVVVRGHKDRPQVISTTLTQAEIKRIPGTAGDALRAVQNLPGVATTSDFSSQLVVQGGGPSDNLYLLDNIPWPFPFHFGGIISTVNSDLLNSVDLYAAGFSARWGGIMDAVLDAKTRPGRSDRIHATADVSMIMSQLLIEGPLGKGPSTFTLAGRRSYFDLLLSRLQSSTFTALPVFSDLGATLDLALGPDDHVRVLALTNDDVLGLMINADQAPNPQLVGEFRLHNAATTTGFSWTDTRVHGLRLVLTPYYYNVLIDDQMGTGFDIYNQSSVGGVKEESSWQLGTHQELGFGASVQRAQVSTHLFVFDKFFSTDPSLTPTAASTTVTAWTFNRSAYVEDRLQLAEPVTVTLGLHYDNNALVADDALEPRVALELKSPGGLLWKAAWGRYAEFPSGFQLNPDLGNPGLTAQIAEHSVLSVEKDLGAGRTVRLDGYYKSYHDLVVTLPDNISLANAGLGQARGVEFFLRQTLGERSFGWLSYAWSKSERWDPRSGEWSLYQFDQTHIANAVLGTMITPAFGLGAKLRYNSGPLVQSVTGTGISYASGTTSTVRTFANTFDQRLGDYLRLDLRAQYAFRFPNWRLNTYFEVLNALGRSNPAGLNYPKDVTAPPNEIDNLPRFPYFGVEAEF